MTTNQEVFRHCISLFRKYREMRGEREVRVIDHTTLGLLGVREVPITATAWLWLASQVKVAGQPTFFVLCRDTSMVGIWYQQGLRDYRTLEPITSPAIIQEVFNFLKLH